MFKQKWNVLTVRECNIGLCTLCHIKVLFFILWKTCGQVIFYGEFNNLIFFFCIVLNRLICSVLFPVFFFILQNIIDTECVSVQLLIWSVSLRLWSLLSPQKEKNCMSSFSTTSLVPLVPLHFFHLHEVPSGTPPPPPQNNTVLSQHCSYALVFVPWFYSRLSLLRVLYLDVLFSVQSGE